jgi:hypothetical protein
MPVMRAASTFSSMSFAHTTSSGATPSLPMRISWMRG